MNPPMTRTRGRSASLAPGPPSRALVTTLRTLGRAGSVVGGGSPGVVPAVRPALVDIGDDLAARPSDELPHLRHTAFPETPREYGHAALDRARRRSSTLRAARRSVNLAATTRTGSFSRPVRDVCRAQCRDGRVQGGSLGRPIVVTIASHDGQARAGRCLMTTGSKSSARSQPRIWA